MSTKTEQNSATVSQRAIKPFDLLDSPQNSTSGLTSKKRREIFLNEKALSQNMDVAKNQEWFGCDLSLIEYPEWQRTKHVHRLHPYLGKFIPQLVELFLRRFFKSGNVILDPFSGSGTTLIEANILGIHSIGFEISPFNILMQEVKTRKRNTDTLACEVKDTLRRVTAASHEIMAEGKALSGRNWKALRTDSEYLNAWYAPRALKEILFYRSIIPEYDNSDVLQIILSRAARSCRLTPHYDLARPKEPLKPGRQYYCRKHKRTCEPICEALKFIKRYSTDTVRRLQEFEGLRSSAGMTIIEGDARTLSLPENTRLDGIFTSPPYVGMIDYHDQHLYAYELFPEFKRKDSLEIGPMSLGKGAKAQAAYSKDIAAVFRRQLPYLKPNAKVFIVANDSASLYPKIIDSAGYSLMETFNRPVPMRTERDTATYFETVFWAEPKKLNR